MSAPRHWEQDKEATVYVGNLDERAHDRIIWELMVQAGRVVNVHLPKDRVTGAHQGFGFVEFTTEADAVYAANIMNQIKLYGKPIRVNKASADKQKAIEVGAELFIGNLDQMVDEKMLYDTFGRFGALVNVPKVSRDDTGLSKGYGFISYADFEASDMAIEMMNGQFLMNKEISVQYAYKQDGKGERHGDAAERELASQAKKHNVQLAIQPLPPHLFQAPASQAPSTPTANGMPNIAPSNSYPPTHQQQQPPQRPPPPGQLPNPPMGLPPRPPMANAGYGGPPGFHPGFPGQPPPGPPPFGQPPGFPGMPAPGMPPPGMGPPGMPPHGMSPPPPMGGPPGFAPPPGMPPGMPPPGYGMPPGQYGQRR